jgi:Type II CAAX prenyl endopeptidase Rce1-like
MSDPETREPIDGPGLIFLLVAPLLLSAVLTPIVARLAGERHPPITPKTKLERSSAARGAFAPGDRIEMRYETPEGQIRRASMDSLQGGRRFADLLAQIRAFAPEARAFLRAGRIEVERGHLSLKTAAGNRGHLDFTQPAYNRREANRRVRKPAHYLMLGSFWLAGWWWLRRRRRGVFPRVGFWPPRASDWGRGFLLGAGTLIAFMAVATLLGKRSLDFDGWGELFNAALRYAPLALLIGLLEDLAFFGFLSCLLGGRWILVALIFAATHFLHADGDRVYAAESWVLGIEAVGASLAALSGIFERPGEFLGLCLIGACLAQLRVRSGALWLGMGLHGGWYWARAVGRRVCANERTDWDTLAGTGLFYDGLFGWVAIAATWFLALRFFLRQPRGNPHGLRVKREP